MQPVQNSIEQSFTRPASIPVIDAWPLAVAIGHVTPLRAAVEHPEEAVERGAMIIPSSPALLFGKQRLDSLPTFIAHFIPTPRPTLHATPRSVSFAVLFGHHWPPCRRPVHTLHHHKAQPVHAPNIRSVRQNLGGAGICVTSMRVPVMLGRRSSRSRRGHRARDRLAPVVGPDLPRSTLAQRPA